MSNNQLNSERLQFPGFSGKTDIKKDSDELLTCAACFRRTGRARFRGRAETAASASYAKRRKKLLYTV